jgi:hypothetical protein
MSHSCQRLSAIFTLALGGLLFLFAIALLLGLPEEESSSGLTFLPVRHESMVLQAGNFRLELSPWQAIGIVLAGSVLFLIAGGLILPRSKMGTGTRHSEKKT